MATLTPGVLLKLLHAMNSPTPSPTPLRPAVLQLTAIVPAAPADLWPSHGFLLQLSDSANSTYVSLPPTSDANSLRLGQLVYVDSLLPSDPLPLPSGLRPLPASRPLPLAGHPQPLLARRSPSGGALLIQPADPLLPLNINLQGKHLTKPDSNGNKEKESVPVPVTAPVKRRFSSPAMMRSGGPRAASPAQARAASPAKCVVPSLVAAREERRSVAREAAIIVPSRYRQPSPVGGRKGAASPAVRRGSASPGRRLSIGMKGSPVGGADGGKRRVARAAEGRKSWEEGEVEEKEGKEKGVVVKSKVDHQAILRTQVAISKRLSDVAKEQPNVQEMSPIKKQSTEDNTESFTVSQTIMPAPPKIIAHDRKWTDGSIPFDIISENVAKLGKEALQRRNIASVAAAEALEEALANESVIRSLSMFSDLCSTSKPGNPLPAIDRFLSIYNDVWKCITIAESLASSRNSNISTERSKSASLWVDAALRTDLEVLSLLNNDTEHPLRSSVKPVVLDPPRAVMSKRNSVGTPAKNNPKILTTNSWSRGSGLSETVDLARELRCEMQTWFLRFVEETLDVGFRMFGENSDDGTYKDNTKMATVLSQLKRVNEWLDGVGKRPVEESLMEKIERLKRKIYGFVITHVGSAFDSSVSLS